MMFGWVIFPVEKRIQLFRRVLLEVIEGWRLLAQTASTRSMSGFVLLYVCCCVCHHEYFGIRAMRILPIIDSVPQIFQTTNAPQPPEGEIWQDGKNADCVVPRQVCRDGGRKRPWRCDDRPGCSRRRYDFGHSPFRSVGRCP